VKPPLKRFGPCLGKPSLAWLCLVLLVQPPQALAVQAQGGPRFATDTSGALVSDFSSTFGVRAEVAGPRAERLAAMTFHPVSSLAAAGLTPGSFSLRLTQDNGTPRLESARQLTFQPWGWEENATDGPLASTVRVFTVARNLFAVVLSVRGVKEPLKLEARVEGVLGDTGLSQVKSAPDSDTPTLRLSTSPALSFDVSFRGTAPVLGSTHLDLGTRYFLTALYGLTEDTTVGFLISFQDAVSVRLEDSPLTQVPPEGWFSPIEAHWNAYLDGFSPVDETSQAWLAADRQAKAMLRHQSLFSSNGGPPGVVYAKGVRNDFPLWDSALAALGASEQSIPRAQQILMAVARGQRGPEASGNEQGLIPYRVTDGGVSIPLRVPGTTDAYSALPLIAAVPRLLYERSGKTDADKAQLDGWYDIVGKLLNWWSRRRDLDGDLLAEANGGQEGGADDSPRFTELWGDSEFSRLAVPDSDTRPRLNTSDLNAFRVLGDIELSRMGAFLGRPDASDWLRRAGLLATNLEDEKTGLWDAARGGYFDATHPSDGRHLIQTRTPAIWWPLVTGLTRDPARVTALRGHILDSSEFNGPFGIPSVAFNDPHFSSREGARGPVFPSTGYFTAMALFRYGYEAEAEALRQRMLEVLAAGPCAFASYDARTGEGLGACGQTAAAGVVLELMRRRYQEEAFAVRNGGPASFREGRIRRLFRLQDGALLFEVSPLPSPDAAPERSSLLPLSRVEARTQVFADEPMTFTFTDPGQLLGGRAFQVTLPSLSSATIKAIRASGATETFNLKRVGETPLAFTAQAGDRIEMPTFRLGEDPGACGCGALDHGSESEFAPVSWGLALILLLLDRRRRGLAACSAGDPPPCLK